MKYLAVLIAVVTGVFSQPSVSTPAFETASWKQTSAPLSFEVASIKGYPPGSQLQGAVGGTCHGTDTVGTTTVALGHCTYTWETLKQLMLQAFPPSAPLVGADNIRAGNAATFKDVAARTGLLYADDWVTQGPDWAGSAYFALDAKAGNPETTTQDQLRAMLQTMVKERFRLTFHLVPKNLSGYFIIAADHGLKLTAAQDSTPAQQREERARKSSAGIKPFPIASGTLTQLAMNLRLAMKVPVITKVDIPGRWDFTPLDGVDLGMSTTPDSDPAGGSIFSVLEEKLGLKLQAQKIPVEIFVIDHAEKPVE